jgi:hypothetical protein
MRGFIHQHRAAQHHRVNSPAASTGAQGRSCVLELSTSAPRTPCQETIGSYYGAALQHRSTILSARHSLKTSNDAYISSCFCFPVFYSTGQRCNVISRAQESGAAATQAAGAVPSSSSPPIA